MHDNSYGIRFIYDNSHCFRSMYSFISMNSIDGETLFFLNPTLSYLIL